MVCLETCDITIILFLETQHSNYIMHKKISAKLKTSINNHSATMQVTNCSQFNWIKTATNIKYKPVGFYGAIAPQFRMPAVRNAPNFDRWTSPHRRFNQNMPPSVVLLQQCHCRNRHRANFKIYLLRQFCSNRVQFFYNTQETDAKNDGAEFWNSNSVIFENFLKSSKRRHAVPLRPIWTIMVAAKLDHSRDLVTKFRQNRSTLKGGSASQRQTDTQTDRQSPLKIRALQVCNRANIYSTSLTIIMWYKWTTVHNPNHYLVISFQGLCRPILYIFRTVHHSTNGYSISLSLVSSLLLLSAGLWHF